MIKVFGRIFARLKAGSGIKHHAQLSMILRVSIVTKLMIQMTRAWVTPMKRNMTGITTRLTEWKQQN
jgi:hypothetical protein